MGVGGEKDKALAYPSRGQPKKKKKMELVSPSTDLPEVLACLAECEVHLSTVFLAK